jgi:hypothetical protein
MLSAVGIPVPQGREDVNNVLNDIVEDYTAQGYRLTVCRNRFLSQQKSPLSA